MNAIVCLCHFCEAHGPSVVFCTQAFRECETSISKVDSMGNVKNDVNIWKYGHCIKTYCNGSQESSVGPCVASCVACRSFPHNEPGFISNDDNARVSYVSSQYPFHAQLSNLVRQACIRSLSCEVIPGREGPIYFGDDTRGHVLCHTFFLRDVQARGFQRWYSLMFFMMDKMFLLNSWSFLVQNLQETIDELQQGACKVYQREELTVSHRSLRSADSMAQDDHKRKRDVGLPRSLVDLVGDSAVWERLHGSFTWMMKAGGMRLKETLADGCQLSCFWKEKSVEMLSIRQLYNLFHVESICNVLHHLWIGNRVFIRGKNPIQVSAIVLSFKPFLPRQCFQAINYATQMQDIDQCCNIIGVIDTVAIASTHNICIVDLGDNSQLVDDVTKQESLPDVFGSFDRCSVKMTNAGHLPWQPPQLLLQLEKSVLNKTLSDSTLSILLATLIEEWSNKAKLWSHMKRANKSATLPGHPSGVGLADGLGMPKLVSDMRAPILSALGVSECDTPLLDFWSRCITPEKT